MEKKSIMLPAQKRIALVAHDACKQDMLEWVKYNSGTLSHHFLFATGTTGSIITEQTGLPVHQFKSGPLGGDMQIGAFIAEGKIDFLIFFWDPMSTHPHDPDVKALLRVATLYNIPTASNRATADLLIASPFMAVPYDRQIADHLISNELASLMLPIAEGVEAQSAS